MRMERGSIGLMMGVRYEQQSCRKFEIDIQQSCTILFGDQMNKRKLDINEIKKNTLRGKKYKSINTKYQVVLSYFKQKQIKNHDIFRITFFPLINDLLHQLSKAQFIYKLQNNIKENLKPLEINGDLIKLDNLFLKYLSKEFPIQEVIQCLYVKKQDKSSKITLGITRNKLMVFFKNLRQIYSQFCFCVGQKTIVQAFDLKSLYENFKCEWAKSQQRGRMLQSQRLEKIICRSLYFLGIIIENNIFTEIQEQQRKKRQQATEPGTKSQKKRNVRGITHQVSSTYSFNSTDMLSNFSFGLTSQRSNDESHVKGGHSEKSEKIVRKKHGSQRNLWQIAEVKDLKIRLEPDGTDGINEGNQFEVDLLSNDVENILIEQAFKIQKFKDVCGRNPIYPNINQYGGYPMYQPQNYFNYQQLYYTPQPYYPFNTNEDAQLYQGRRSLGLSNLVETRKTQSRLGNKQYS